LGRRTTNGDPLQFTLGTELRQCLADFSSAGLGRKLAATNQHQCFGFLLQASEKIEQVCFMQQAQLQAHGAGEIGVIERGRIVERDLRAEFVSHAGKPQLALDVTQHLRPVQALFLTGDAGLFATAGKAVPFP
jgi:hypothetical protein